MNRPVGFGVGDADGEGGRRLRMIEIGVLNGSMRRAGQDA